MKHNKVILTRLFDVFCEDMDGFTVEDLPWAKQLWEHAPSNAGRAWWRLSASMMTYCLPGSSKVELQQKYLELKSTLRRYGTGGKCLCLKNLMGQWDDDLCTCGACGIVWDDVDVPWIRARVGDDRFQSPGSPDQMAHFYLLWDARTQFDRVCYSTYRSYAMCAKYEKNRNFNSSAPFRPQPFNKTACCSLQSCVSRLDFVCASLSKRDCDFCH